MYLMKMKDQSALSDLTFLLLVRLDTIERLENTLSVTKFINSHFDAGVSILECASHKNGLLEKLLGNKISYTFLEDHDPILFRTRFLNMMTRSVQTPFVAIWDTDVIAPVGQVVKAINILRNGEADFVYPYEKQFLDTSPILRNMYLKDRNIEVLEQNMKKMKELYPPNPVGGAFLANRKAYTDAGLENENFYGWGLEDGERYYRWLKHNYIIKRVAGPLFHLSHGRGLNSVFHNSDQQIAKRKEILGALRRMGDNGNETSRSYKQQDKYPTKEMPIL